MCIVKVICKYEQRVPTPALLPSADYAELLSWRRMPSPSTQPRSRLQYLHPGCVFISPLINSIEKS
jgi:hypothetical protein